MSNQCQFCEDSLIQFPVSPVLGISVVRGLMPDLRLKHPKVAEKLSKHLSLIKKRNHIFNNSREYEKALLIAKELRKVPPEWGKWENILPDVSLCTSCQLEVLVVHHILPAHVEWLAENFPTICAEWDNLADNNVNHHSEFEALRSTIETLGPFVKIEAPSVFVGSIVNPNKVYRISIAAGMRVDEFRVTCDIMASRVPLTTMLGQYSPIARCLHSRKCVHPAIALQNMILGLHNDPWALPLSVRLATTGVMII
jgi:hypothetical protein